MNRGLQSSRRFHLLDAAILVAVAAATMAAVRSIVTGSMYENIERFIECLGLGQRCSIIGLVTIYGPLYPLLTIWNVGYLAIRLRQPRPRHARLWRQPGFVASVAVSLITAINFFHYLIGYRAGDLWASRFSILVTHPNQWFYFLLPESADVPQVGPGRGFGLDGPGTQWAMEGRTELDRSDWSDVGHALDLALRDKSSRKVV